MQERIRSYKTNRRLQNKESKATNDEAMEIDKDGRKGTRRGAKRGPNQRMALPGLEGYLLLVHGLRVQLRERVGGAAEGRIQRAIHLIESRRLRFPLPRHRFREDRDRQDGSIEDETLGSHTKRGGRGGWGRERDKRTALHPLSLTCLCPIGFTTTRTRNR